ncbi:MAG: serine hydrolase [Coriobacteriia bacterium]|nr:serine hydrolase [Coriobacteriia bacterium]
MSKNYSKRSALTIFLSGLMTGAILFSMALSTPLEVVWGEQAAVGAVEPRGSGQSARSEEAGSANRPALANMPRLEVAPEPTITSSPSIRSEPLTIEELKAVLSSFDAGSEPSSIGAFALGHPAPDFLTAAIEDIEERGYNVGFVVMDINTGHGVAYNADEVFYSASSIKGHYVASLVSERPELIQLQADMMRATVKDSNNDTYFALRLGYGDAPFTQWCEEAEVDNDLAGVWFPHYSARDLAKLWLRTYEFLASEGEGITEAASWYSESFNSPIHQYFKETYKVHTKPGWIADPQDSATVDAGIVYAGASPYIMVVMTNAPADFSVMEALVPALNEIHGYLLA